MVICRSPKGFRVDYFIDKGTFKHKKEGGFIEERVRMDDVSVVLVYDTSNEKIPLLGVLDSTGPTPPTELVPILIEPDQITFTGVLNKVVILFTIYPKEKAAVYTRHSRYNGIDIDDHAKSIRTTCLYMKCTFDTEKSFAEKSK